MHNMSLAIASMTFVFTRVGNARAIPKCLDDSCPGCFLLHQFFRASFLVTRRATIGSFRFAGKISSHFGLILVRAYGERPCQ